MKIIKAINLVHDFVSRDEEENEITVRAIDGVNIEVEKGQFIVVLGHNGSGKSSFAKHINALLKPTNGTVLVSDMDTKKNKNKWKIRQTAGMVFQNPDNQLVSSVVEEDVAFGPENLGVETDEIWNRVNAALEAVDMTAYRYKSPTNLSGGQKQRVAIAGIMAMEPECIILDEPTAMLDPVGRKEVISAIHELNQKKGITIILITHHMEEAINADKLFVMDKGKVVLEGAPTEVFSQVEKMKSIGLEVPQTTELAYMLKKEKLDLSDGIIRVDNLVDEIVKLYNRQTKEILMNENESVNKICENENQSEIKVYPQNITLEIENVNYTYGVGTYSETKALNNINLTIKSGEFVGIIGHTGSGKSTLVQHLNGLEKATSGAIYCNGTNIYDSGYDLRELRCRVGIVFQYPEHQLFESSVINDVCFGPKNKGFSAEEALEKAKKALQQVGIKEEQYYKSPFELSGGQKRRVAIAGVLAMEPEILVLDEPTAGLDPIGRNKILNLIAGLQKERGIAVVLVSHSMEDVAKYVDRIIVMNKGSVMYDDSPKEVFKHYKELEKVGLSAPQITYIMNRLKEKGVPVNTDIINLEEAKKEIQSVIWR